MDTKLWFVFGVCSGSHWQLKASPESVPDVPKNDIKVLEKLKAWEKIQREDLSNLCARFFADGAHVEAVLFVCKMERSTHSGKALQTKAKICVD